MKNLYRVIKWLFAANALAFLLMFVAFFIVFFVRDPVEAGKVWGTPAYYFACWAMSILVCIKFLRT
jgi:hypothetical protein